MKHQKPLTKSKPLPFTKAPSGKLPFTKAKGAAGGIKLPFVKKRS